MSLEEVQYALEPAAFHSMQEAQELIGTLERNPELPRAEGDAEAIGLAIRELVSDTGPSSTPASPGWWRQALGGARGWQR